MNPDQGTTSQTQPLPAHDTPSAQSRKPLPKKFFIIGGLLLLLIIAIALTLLFGKSEKTTSKDNTSAVAPTSGFEEIKETAENSPTAKASSHVVVYGSWTGQSSLIKAIDTNTSKTQLIATLPMAIKKVAVLNNQSLLYIGDVDKKDHGKNVTIYDIKEKKVVSTISASEGYGIDEYTLSPDKKHLALWEVQFAQGSEILQGGKSRVYTVALANPTVKNLIYDEQALQPIHYPRAILNDGTVFMDMFMPNDPLGGAGWAYGMSMASFDGTNKRDIDSLKSGTYGNQPALSQEGRYLLLTGYDGKYGDGTGVKNGIRQAILTSNTVDLVDTKTLQRYKLPNLSNNDSYASAHWDFVTGKIILSVVGATADKTGLYAYDIASKSLQKISVPSINNTEYMQISNLPNNQLLIGTFEENSSNLGNLGANYEYAYTKLMTLDTKTSKSKPISLEDTYAQYITVLPADYFNNVLGIKTIAQANPQPTFVDQYSDQNATKERLQLYTFFLKYDLQPVRLKQQSTPVSTTPVNLSKITLTPNTTYPPHNDDNMPKCNDVTAKVCAEKGQGPGTKDYTMCKGMYKAQNMERTCDDSPLYLYGTPGQKVQVTINTPVYNAIPSYDRGYEITLMQHGKMLINNNSYDRISYDYSSNLKIRKAPKEGSVTTKENLPSLLKDYARKLGLNDKETKDLISAGLQKVKTPYAFVSFYDHETSHRILPITFNPQPDNYLNVVFYFKQLQQKPNLTPVPPTFPDPVKRDGFTAIEVSEVVE